MTKSNDGLKARYPKEYWDEAGDYLQEAFILHHNPDYLEFLVERVWKLDQVCRLCDFGCGNGRMGMQLLPLFAPGSTYTGIDQSASLLAHGREIWAKLPWQAAFHQGSIYETPFEDQEYDVTLIHTVLMHVPHPEKVIKEMMRVTKPGGLVIACEANRNAHTAMLHIEELNHQEVVPLEFFQTMNRAIRQRTGVDHNIGAKLPVILHKAGLVEVQVRLDDAIRFICPPLDTDEKKRLFKAVCDQGYGQVKPDEAGMKKWIAAVVDLGFPEDEAIAEINRELAMEFLGRGHEYHTVYPPLLTWCFGRVAG